MLDLNKSSISHANDASMFNAGDSLAREAESVYKEGLDKMQKPFQGETLNEQQAEIMSRRLDEWKTLVEKAYNEIISRRASWMPWTVCGPARYNSKRENAKADKQMQVAQEWDGKMDRYIENTVQMIRDAIPHDQLIQEYRAGKRREAISSDDPDAAEKLSARIEGLKEQHERMKVRNAHWRKHGTMKGCPGISGETALKMDAAINAPNNLYHVPYAPYELQLSNANIKRLEERLQTIQQNQEAGEVEEAHNGFTVRQSGTDGRVYVLFDSKPGEEARDVLKQNGFHWSPRAKVWQRTLTPNAARDVRRYVVPALLSLPEYAPAQEEQAAALSLEQFSEQYAPE